MHANKSPLTADKMYIKAWQTADGYGRYFYANLYICIYIDTVAIILIICQRIDGRSRRSSCSWHMNIGPTTKFNRIDATRKLNIFADI